MHPSVFNTKQAHLSTLLLYREFAEPLGLTPARMDMLRAIAIHERPITQAQLWRLLSVCKAVVSVMVRSLEKLGFVERTRCLWDQRTHVVKVTDAGIAALRELFYETRTHGLLRCAYLAPFLRPDKPMEQWERELDELSEINYRIRKGFGRTLENPWGNDPETDELVYYADVPGNPIRIDIQNTWEEDWVAGIPVKRDYSNDPTAPWNWRTWRPLVDPFIREARRQEAAKRREAKREEVRRRRKAKRAARRRRRQRQH
jgi:DNA-binding MarR family transcriptional regulator